MASSKYVLSFTACGVLQHESTKLAQLYLELKDWDAVKKQVMDQNVLQSRTTASLIRLYNELSLRLKTLTEEQLQVLVNGNPQDGQHILWIAICKAYDYIREFMLEVVIEKYRGLNYDLIPSDYDSFYNSKSEWHAELDALSVSTQDKLKQVLFRMLREAEIVSKKNQINPQHISPSVIRAIMNDSPDLLYVFPIPEARILEIINDFR